MGKHANNIKRGCSRCSINLNASCTKTNGNLWKSMKIYEHMWKSMKNCQNIKRFVQFYESLRKSMSICENLRVSLKICLNMPKGRCLKIPSPHAKLVAWKSSTASSWEAMGYFQPPPKFDGCVLLKALWGGHTAAHQFMFCIKFPIGERKHATWSRRLHEDEIVTACTAVNTTQMVFACLCAGPPRCVLHELALLQFSESCIPPAAGGRDPFSEDDAWTNAKMCKCPLNCMW